jgi:PAS domain S-box-containing protein
MIVKLSLAQRGMLLLAIPFMLQLVFFLILGSLLDKSEKNETVEYHSKSVVGHINWGASLITLQTLSFLGYVLSHDKDYLESYQACKKEVKPNFDELDGLFDDNKQQQEQLIVLKKSADRLSSWLESDLEKIDLTNPKDRESLTGSEMKKLWMDMCYARKIIAKLERHRYNRQRADLPEARRFMKDIINVGLVADIGMAFLIIFFYSTGIAKRLNILNDNSYRLVRGDPLNPPVGGTDEIGILDGSFHSMANALTQAHEKERAVIDNMLVGLITLDPNGNIESTNPRIETIFGLKAAELINTDVMMLLVAPANEVFDFSNYLLKQSLNKIAELDARRENGDIFPIELSVSQFDSKQGKKFLANILDVSERREVEKLKRAFVATVTHELRTPLTSIKGALSILRSGALGPMSESMKNTVTIAERNSTRLMALINDILDTEKLQAGTVQMNKVNIRLEKVVERALESVNSFAEQHDVRVESAVTKASVYIDQDKVVQVIVNLVSNAVKFSPVESTVSISFEEKENLVEVRVTDQGIGIPQHSQSMLFQRFQQIQSEDPRHKGGTGLGLAICKQIIEQNGGSIGVRSKEAEGSTFWFTIPKAANTSAA